MKPKFVTKLKMEYKLLQLYVCFRVRFIIKQVVCWLWCSNISKTGVIVTFVLSMTSIAFLSSVNLLCYFLYDFLFSIVCSVIQSSSHDYWVILCIAHWNCISVSVHVIFYFEVLLASMFIFETENRIKLSSHNSGQINHPINVLFKKPITSWILNATWKEQTQV